MPRLGVIGTLVWDEIHGRTPGAGVEREWGGIAYALAGLDAALADDWEIVPLVTVGRDRAAQAARLLSGIRHRAAGARFVETDAPTTQVTLHYVRGERQCGGRAGGTPGWASAELVAMVQGLDALYVNFVTGAELPFETALAVRAAFGGPIYADLHQLDAAGGADAALHLPSWFRCFDAVQLNEHEMARLGGDPLAIAARATADGTSLLLVTLGARGAIYVAAPGFERWDGERLARSRQVAATALVPPHRAGGTPLRTALVPAPATEAVDTTGCGDVFGATCTARLLAGDAVEAAVAAANARAARTAAYRGAEGLAAHLLGTLVAP